MFIIFCCGDLQTVLITPDLQSQEAHTAALKSAKALAVTVLEVLSDEGFLKAAKEEYKQMLENEEI
jgi:hypothetical protein